MLPRKRKLFVILVSALLIVVYLYETDTLRLDTSLTPLFRTTYDISANKTAVSKYESIAGYPYNQEIKQDCKVLYVGCFQPMHGLLPLEESLTLRGLDMSCNQRNGTYYYANLRNGSVLCGLQVAKKYVENDQLLPNLNEKECMDGHKAYPVYLNPDQCQRAQILDAGLLSARDCHSFCYKLDFVLFGLSKEGNCWCTFPALNGEKNLSVCKDKLTFAHTAAADKRCLRKVFLRANAAPLIALISFPGSGNSWTRHLIELATGVYSGSIYFDEGMYQKGYLGEYLRWDSGKTVVIKSHKPSYDRHYEKIILLVRNPYDAILAEFNRLHGGHTGYADEKMFVSNEWKVFVPYKIKKWAQTCFTYVEGDIPILLVYYESLMQNPKREITRMTDWINITIPNFDERLSCTLSNIAGLLQRKRRKMSFNPFNDEATTFVNSEVKKVRLLVKQYKLQDLPMYERNT